MKTALYFSLALAAYLATACGSSNDSSTKDAGVQDAGHEPEPKPLTGDLDVDIRGSVHVELSADSEDLEASLTFKDGYHLAPSGTKITGKGHREAFPESDTALYTARFDAPADPAGPCGASPVSLSLALRRRGKNARVSGGLTAYCGKDTWAGVPARVLRLTGLIPAP